MEEINARKKALDKLVYKAMRLTDEEYMELLERSARPRLAQPVPAPLPPLQPSSRPPVNKKYDIYEIASSASWVIEHLQMQECKNWL